MSIHNYQAHTPSPLQQWLDARLPGSEVMESVQCDSALLHVFQRGGDKLSGIVIQGELGNEQALDAAMHTLIQKYGPFTVIFSPTKFDGLVHKYLPQVPASASDLADRLTKLKISQPCAVDGQNQKAKANPQSSSLHPSLQPRTGRDVRLMTAYAYDRYIKEGTKGLETGIVNEKTSAQGLHTNLGEVPHNATWAGNPSGPTTDIKNVLGPVIESGDIKEFDRLMPHFDKADHDSFRWRDTGIAYRSQDVPILKAIRESLVKRQEFQTELNQVGLLGEWFKSQWRPNEAARVGADLSRGMLQLQHAPWDQSLAHLEHLALLMNSDGGFAAFRQCRLGNQLIANVRLLHLRLAQFKEMQLGAGNLSALCNIGLSIATLEPTLACISLYASIVAMVRSSGTEGLPPLTQQLFLDVINQGIFPLIQDVHQSLASGQNRLADQTDEQTTALLQAMNHCQQELNELIARFRGETEGRFDAKEFNDFVKGGQTRLQAYRDELLKVKGYIKGEEVTIWGWFQKYYDMTLKALENGRGNLANGFNGSQPTYPATSAAQNPIYATGIIYHQVFGNQQFPPELPVLDSAAYTFICLIKAMLEKPVGMFRSPENRNLMTLGKKLLDGVHEQQALFAKLSLGRLLVSHQAFIQNVQKAKRSVEEARKNVDVKAKEFVEQNRQSITDATVGSEMYAWSKFVTRPLNLTPYVEEVQSTVANRQILNALTLSLTNIHWAGAAGDIDTYVSKIGTLRGLPKSVDYGGKGYHTTIYGKVERRIWWNKEAFDSSVTVSVLSRLPFVSLLSGSLDEVHVINNPPIPPKKSLLDCTVTYEPKDWKLNTVYHPDSRLQEQDVKGIPSVNEDWGAQRKTLTQDVLRLLKGAYIPERNPLREFVGRYENCLPLREGMTPLPLPKVLMEFMRQTLCTDRDKMALMGVNVDVKYDFEKSRIGDLYRLTLHAVYEGSIPYQSRTVFEVDAVTVESFAKQLHEGAQPNITEFLYTALFSGNYPGEGLPGFETHFNEKSGIIAPDLMIFPGLFKILERCPHLCFTFNHRRYFDLLDCKFLDEFLETGKLDDRGKFFRMQQMQVDPKNYMSVQQTIRRKAAAIEHSVEYQSFKQQYDLFIALATLVSSADVDVVRGMAATWARIIPPGEMGWLEQAYYYAPPAEDDLKRLLSVLTNNPSLAKTRLDQYAKKLPEIIEFLKRIESGEFIPSNQQKEFAIKLGFDKPSKSRANLEEDVKNK